MMLFHLNFLFAELTFWVIRIIINNLGDSLIDTMVLLTRLLQINI